MMPGTADAVQHQTVTENQRSLNPLFSSLEGNPFAEPVCYSSYEVKCVFSLFRISPR